MYKIAYAPSLPENKHNIAVEMATAILKSKLAMLEASKTVGSSGDGTHIEYIARIEDNPDGAWQYLVKTWSGLSDKPDQAKVMSFIEVADLVCRVAVVDDDLFEYLKKIPIVPEMDARKDS